MPAPPRLPDAPPQYEPGFFNMMNRVLNLYFTQLASVTKLRGSTLNLNIDNLPTQASLATLRSGDVYRDTTAANVLKIKV